jgi:tRNA(Arg) A34 adenosine deaminase TadA
MITEQLTYGTSFDYYYTPEDLSVSDWNRLLRAARIAEDSSHRFRIGCTAISAGRVLASSTNRYKSHPNIPPARMSMHAEAHVISMLPDASGVTLYVARLDKSDRLCTARSCLYCVSQMLDVGVDRVVFSTGHNSAESFRLKTVKSDFLT